MTLVKIMVTEPDIEDGLIERKKCFFQLLLCSFLWISVLLLIKHLVKYQH
jgi:hypothetical protein